MNKIISYALKLLSLPKKLLRKEMTTKEEFFTPENKIENSEVEILSDSGNYKLVVSNFKTIKGSWNYSRGTVFKKDSDTPISVINRNYGSFPFTFVEAHKNGHDYLICGEDYQGQTIIELDTGKRVDYLLKSAEQGHGFCWVNMTASPDKQMLAVEGCFWACPYEIVFYDFSDPFNFPYPELDRKDYDTFGGWTDNTTVEFEDSQYDDDDKYITTKHTWTKPADIDTARKYIIETFGWRKNDNYPVSDDFKQMASILIKRLDDKDKSLLLLEREVIDLVEWAKIDI